MSGGIGPIASAVVAPELSAQSPPRKRRQSSISNTSLASNTSPKRLKLSADETIESPSTLVASPPVGVSQAEPTKSVDIENGRELGSDERKNKIQEERKRSRRLFGGLLSALNQSVPSGQQKRRQEIEKRQVERARQQKNDDEAHRAERLAKLKAARKVEQVKYNKESMRTRHSNMLSRAHFLSTKAEPKLYYKPWQLLPEEEDRIKEQIADVEFLIEREVDEFRKLHPDEQPNGTPTPRKGAETPREEAMGGPRAVSPPNPTTDTDPANPPAQDPPSDQAMARKQSLEEHNGEVVVEADEDTVIY